MAALSMTNRLSWLTTSLEFFKKHFITILTCGFIAGIGRVAQLRGFGEITPVTNVLLEIVIESSRLFLLVFVLGSGNALIGWGRIRIFFTDKKKRADFIRDTFTGLKRNGWPILFSLIAFSVIAVVLNVLIQQLAYETCLFITLKLRGVLSESSSEWTILLFFKNLSVIPFTLIFQTLLLLWAKDRIDGRLVKAS